MRARVINSGLRHNWNFCDGEAKAGFGNIEEEGDEFGGTMRVTEIFE